MEAISKTSKTEKFIKLILISLIGTILITISAKVKKIIKIKSENLNGINFSYSTDNEITAMYERKKHKIDEIINKVKNAGMEIYDISTDEGNLEDVFIDLTKS